MRISSKKSGSRRLLKISGSVTVSSAEKLRQALLRALEGPEKEIEMALDEVEEADLTFLQIVASAQKSVGKGKRFLVRRPVSAAVAEVTRLSGFGNHGNCLGEHCLWCALSDTKGGA